MMEWFVSGGRPDVLAAGRTMLQQLDPVTRARVLMALLGLVILGTALMLLAWLGARMVRRYQQRSFTPDRTEQAAGQNEDDWWKKRLEAGSNASDVRDERG
jgi:hypothetical protein